MKNLQQFLITTGLALALSADNRDMRFQSPWAPQGRGNDIHKGFASNKEIIEKMKQNKKSKRK
jgi:hypothetical protein